MNYIGLDKTDAKELAVLLNQLLSSYQIHYQNVRGLHWNVEGDKFFELHVKYEEIYTRVQVIIDDIAERILTLDGNPLHTYAAYIKSSVIKELSTTTEGMKGMDYLLRAQKELLVLEREILEASSEISDEGTSALMSDLIREKEKSSWMYKSWLSK